MNVLVTGGAGYIGSHVVNVLKKEQGFTPIVYDNFSTGHPEAVSDDVQLVEGDIRDVQFLKHIMAQFEIDAVIHFAASSLVGESMSDPAKYYVNNVEGSLHLLQAMKESGVDYIVFSSTAAVYGEPEKKDKAREYKHMTFLEAADMAKRAQVKQMWLTHYSPSLIRPEDYMDGVRKIFPQAIAGKDGKSIDLLFEED